MIILIMYKRILKYKNLLLIVLLFLSSRFYFLIIDQRIWWDSVVSLATADWFLSKKYYIEFFRPPIWPIVLAAFGSLFGVSFLLERILSFTFSLFSLILMYFGLQHTYPKIAAYSAFLLSVFPFNIIFSYRLYESFSIFINTAMLLVFFLYMKTTKRKFLLASGILFGIAVMTKYIAGIFLLFFVIVFLIKKMKKELTIFLISSCLPLIPWFLFYWLNFSNPFYPLTETFSVTFSKPLGTWYSMLLYVPEVFGLGIFLILFSPKKNDKIQNVFLIAIAIFVIVFSLLSRKEARYLLVLTPMVAITAANGLLALKKKIRVFLMLILILMLGYLYTIPFASETFHDVSNLLYDLEGNILTTDSPLVSFTLKRSVNQISMLKLTDPCEEIEKHDIDWVFFSNREDWFRENKVYYQQRLDTCTTKIKGIDFGFEQYYILKSK